MKHAIETELVLCGNMNGGVLFGITKTNYRHYAGLMTKVPHGYTVTLPDGSESTHCPSWDDVENLVNEFVLKGKLIS